jgi:hypothetical protein
MEAIGDALSPFIEQTDSNNKRMKRITNFHGNFFFQRLVRSPCPMIVRSFYQKKMALKVTFNESFIFIK